VRKDKVYIEGERQPLSKSLQKTAISQFHRLGRVDISEYTYEHRGTNYPEAKPDLMVYDGSGKLVFRGREFGGHQIFLWEAHNEGITATPLATPLVN
jgi:hypothetical protein